MKLFEMITGTNKPNTEVVNPNLDINWLADFKEYLLLEDKAQELLKKRTTILNKHAYRADAFRKGMVDAINAHNDVNEHRLSGMMFREAPGLYHNIEETTFDKFTEALNSVVMAADGALVDYIVNLYTLTAEKEGKTLVTEKGLEKALAKTAKALGKIRVKQDAGRTRFSMIKAFITNWKETQERYNCPVSFDKFRLCDGDADELLEIYEYFSIGLVNRTNHPLPDPMTRKEMMDAEEVEFKKEQKKAQKKEEAAEAERMWKEKIGSVPKIHIDVEEDDSEVI